MEIITCIVVFGIVAFGLCFAYEAFAVKQHKRAYNVLNTRHAVKVYEQGVKDMTEEERKIAELLSK